MRKAGGRSDRKGSMTLTGGQAMDMDMRGTVIAKQPCAENITLGAVLFIS